MKLCIVCLVVLLISCTPVAESSKSVDESFIGSYEGTFNGSFEGSIRFEVTKSESGDKLLANGSVMFIATDEHYRLEGSVVRDGELTLAYDDLVFKAQIIKGRTEGGTWTYPNGIYDRETHRSVDARGEFKAIKRN